MSIGQCYKYLDTLEIMVGKGLPVPLTGLVLLDEEKLQNEFDKIRATLPKIAEEAKDNSSRY